MVTVKSVKQQHTNRSVASRLYARYARRHNSYVRTVRGSTMSNYAAVLEWAVATGAKTLEEAREQFAKRYPDTQVAGPMHVNNWIR